MVLYLLTNTVNGKQYVGITTQPIARRWSDHVSKAHQGRQTIIALAMRKHGAEMFTMTLLGEASSWEELCAMEQAAIASYQTFHPHGYNMTHGGDGTLGRLHSEDTKQRIAAKKRGIPLQLHVRLAVSQCHKGIPKSPEQRLKISEAQRGEKNHHFGKGMSDDLKQKLLEVNTGNQYGLGRTLSSEARAYLSSIRKGKTHTAATKAKIAESKLGKPRSEDTKAKVAAGVKAYQATHANPMQGRTQSAETKALIAAKARARGDGLRYEGIDYPSIADAVDATGLSRMQLLYRIKQGTAMRLKKE